MKTKLKPNTENLRVAVIYYHITSVGGINSECQNFKIAAEKAGDTFHIYRTTAQKTKRPTLYPEPKLVAGGDTKILIDGDLSYHESQFPLTKKYLEENYDVMFFIHPCPHPNKNWEKEHGANPIWDIMYREVDLPKITRFLDGYYETYRWIDPVLPLCEKVLVNQPAYAIPLQKAGLKPVWVPKPFAPRSLGVTRSLNPYLIWPNQWKDIKGIKKFMNMLPHIHKFRSDMSINLFSTGIVYYQLRITPEWRKIIGADWFYSEKGNLAPTTDKYHQGPKQEGKLKGPECIQYQGWLPLEEMAEQYALAWCMVDLQGISYNRSRFPHYAGSFNNTEVEALYYGCRPIVHSTMLRSPIPNELLLTIDNENELPGLIRNITPWRKGNKLWKRAQEWVLETHGADKLWEMIRGYYGA